MVGIFRIVIGDVDRAVRWIELPAGDAGGCERWLAQGAGVVDRDAVVLRRQRTEASEFGDEAPCSVVLARRFARLELDQMPVRLISGDMRGELEWPPGAASAGDSREDFVPLRIDYGDQRRAAAIGHIDVTGSGVNRDRVPETEIEPTGEAGIEKFGFVTRRGGIKYVGFGRSRKKHMVISGIDSNRLKIAGFSTEVRQRVDWRFVARVGGAAERWIGAGCVIGELFFGAESFSFVQHVQLAGRIDRDVLGIVGIVDSFARKPDRDFNTLGGEDVDDAAGDDVDVAMRVGGDGPGRRQHMRKIVCWRAAWCSQGSEGQQLRRSVCTRCGIDGAVIGVARTVNRDRRRLRVAQF